MSRRIREMPSTRRALVLGLALLAISVGLLNGIGAYFPVLRELPLSPRIKGYLLFHDGLARLYLYRGSTPISFDFSDNSLRLEVWREDGSLAARVLHASAWRIPRNELVATQVGPATPHAAVKVVGVRCQPFWPMAAMLAYPLCFYASVAYHRIRQKEGHCEHCGYDLTGNVSGICPECGRSCRRKDAGRPDSGSGTAGDWELA